MTYWSNLPLEERFELHIERIPFHECWEWTGTRPSNRYGQIVAHGKKTPAHRVAWMLYRGPIPEGMYVLHKCDNMGCVNPAHLFLGTLSDNMQDMVAKGRGPDPSTHCRKGHEFALVGWYKWGKDGRRCRACVQARRDRTRERRNARRRERYALGFRGV